MKYYNSDIVFQEIPDETTLAINITGCPIHCEGCHSKWLWEDAGMPLYEEEEGDDDAANPFRGLDEIVGKYAGDISCVCFMGGDQAPETVELMAMRLRRMYPALKVGWYSGRPAPLSPAGELFTAVQEAVPMIDITLFDFIKLGPYVAELGGLRSPSTNQRLYRIYPDGTARLLRIHDPRRSVLGA